MDPIGYPEPKLLATMTRRLAVTYSSGVIIEDPQVLATLAVFYDEVWLPNDRTIRDHGWEEFSYPMGGDEVEWVASLFEPFEKWESRWSALFAEGIFRRLDDSSAPRLPYSMKDFPSVTFPNLASGRVALAVHQLSKKPSPELFVSIPTDTTTSRLAGFLVRSFFEYRLPKLNDLTPDQILEVRHELRDTKEGFTHYVSELTDDIEERMRSGDTSESVAAAKTLQRNLLPKYDEFRRQLMARKTGWWASVLDAAGTFLQIDATPWTPKFYGEAVRATAKLFQEAAGADKQDLTNQGQAFQYLARLEKTFRE